VYFEVDLGGESISYPFPLHSTTPTTPTHQPKPKPQPPKLLASGVLPLRQRLEIMLTASAILRGQGESLNIDRRAFYAQLYAATLLAPLMPLLDDSSGGGRGGRGGGGEGRGSSKQQQGGGGVSSSRGEDEGEDEEAAVDADIQIMAAADALTGGTFGLTTPAAAAAALVQQLQPGLQLGGGALSQQRLPEPTAVLLVRCLEQLLLGVKQTDLARLAAFTKRLSTLMLQVRRVVWVDVR